ncbi:hypothetical protein ACPZ19_49740 [Amycolatopsis lurida]
MRPVTDQAGLAYSTGTVEDGDRSVGGGAVRQHIIERGHLVLTAGEVPHWRRQLPRHWRAAVPRGRNTGLLNSAPLLCRSGP